MIPRHILLEKPDLPAISFIDITAKIVNHDKVYTKHDDYNHIFHSLSVKHIMKNCRLLFSNFYDYLFFCIYIFPTKAFFKYSSFILE